MKSVMKTTLLAAAAAIALPLAGSAGTITLEKTHTSIFGDPALFDDVKIGGDATDDLHVYAGGFHVTSSASESFVAWCIDLAENLILPNEYEMATTPFTSTVTQKLSQLFTGYVEDIDTDTEAAAFQVSIWELISDTDSNLDAGDFQVFSNDAVRSTANGYLAGLSGYDANYELSFFLADGTQDLMTGQRIVQPPSSVSPVPLPATGLLLLAGLGALGLRARKRS